MAIRSLLLPLALLVLAAASSAAVAQLEIGFYSKTCPDAEKIVGEEMAKIIAAAPSLAGPLLRLHFHDCFVRVSTSLPTLRSIDHDGFAHLHKHACPCTDG